MTLSSDADLWQCLAAYTLPSTAASEQSAWEHIAVALQGLYLREPLLNQMQTALTEVIRHQQESASLSRVNVFAKLVAATMIDTSQPAVGWGFFFIERTWVVGCGSSKQRQRAIDLYLYPEGPTNDAKSDGDDSTNITE